MKILFIVTSFNSLSQKVYVELKNLNHEIYVEYFINDNYIKNKVLKFKPDLILCPFLTKKISKEIYENYIVLILHPGIPGDAGPSSLDWALYNKESLWGVTLLKANEEFDKGPIISYKLFSIPARKKLTKSSLYRKEIVEASTKIIIDSIKNFVKNNKKLIYLNVDKNGVTRPLMTQKYRKINFNINNTDEIFKIINMSDSQPGVLVNIKNIYDEKTNMFKFILNNNLDEINDYYIYGSHIESLDINNYNKYEYNKILLIYKKANLGEIFLQRNLAICIKTIDGALWITHLRKRKNINEKFKGLHVKLPSIYNISKFDKSIFNINESDIINNKRLENTFQEIYYKNNKNISYVYFNFYNGAMSTYQCKKLINILKEIIKNNNIKIIVLFGGEDYFSNGINLCTIEDSIDPINESWENINAINDVVELILTSPKYFISAIKANCGAGGVTMAISSDKVISKKNIIFNMHYKGMGLYGSEYWTYILPKRIGSKETHILTDSMLPINSIYAKKIGLIDEYVDLDNYVFEQYIKDYINKYIVNNVNNLIINKIRNINENLNKINKCRSNELNIMKNIFEDKKSNYHKLRYNFVRKINPLETPYNISVSTKNEDIIFPCLIQDH